MKTVIEMALEAVLAEQPAQQEPVCKHEWFHTGAMAPMECRCIKCGAWLEARGQA